MGMRMSKRWREDDKEDGSPEPYELPPEIIGEILIRLPAKSIGRFRCVSKLFRSLSSDLRFAKSHIDLTIRKDSVHRKLLMYYFNGLYTLDLDSIGAVCEGARDLIAVELNYPLEQIAKPYESNCAEIVGSCNGLVCMSSSGEEAIFLFNPTTGESKRLPVTVTGYVESFRTCGFAFDDMTNDCKVVKLVSDVDGDILSASVYSLKANSWRRILDLSYQHWNACHSGVILNGACHWVFTLHEGDKYKRVVILNELFKANTYVGSLVSPNSFGAEN